MSRWAKKAEQRRLVQEEVEDFQNRHREGVENYERYYIPTSNKADTKLLVIPKPTLTKSPKQAEPIELCMSLWGIKPDQKYVHEKFWKQAKLSVERAINNIHPKPRRHLVLLHEQHYKADPVKSNSMILDELSSSIVQGGILVVNDALSGRLTDLPFCPPYRWGRYEGDYIPRQEYQVFPEGDLDPLRRFSVTKLTDHTQILSKLERDPDEAYGVVLTSMVIGHSTAHCVCWCCNKKTLRWNASGFAKWNKLVCESCGSVYEVGTKQNLDKKLQRGFIASLGDFEVFQQVQHYIPRSANHYILLIEFDTLKRPGCARVVYIATIQRAEPFLKTKSFGAPLDSIPIYSKVYVGRPSHWATLPDYPIDAQAIYRASMLRSFERQSPIAKKPIDQLKQIHSLRKMHMKEASTRSVVENAEREVRLLRRKRNEILKLERLTSESLSDDEKAILDSKECVLVELKRREEQLKSIYHLE